MIKMIINLVERFTTVISCDSLIIAIPTRNDMNSITEILKNIVTCD